MAESEFDIIQHYFSGRQPGRADVVAGIGDDAALLRVAPGSELVVCMDTLVAGVHFPESTAAAAIGHKALAVNLSDLAAMGAEPAWATLALTLPASDPDWLRAFADAFFTLADSHGVQLVGGDTTCGPLAVTVQAHGFVPAGQALRRRGARPGDRVYVTGTLGDAGLALHEGVSVPPGLQARLDFPQPRIAAGLALRGQASAAIDISDGLLADLGHLLEYDGLGATLQVDAVPRSADFLAGLQPLGAAGEALFYELPLAAGDDYELCFTVPEDRCHAVQRRLAEIACAGTLVGVIDEVPGIRCHRSTGEPYHPSSSGYRHFNEAG
ncbi:MAG: thiamine-phosphate kinase [Gammaproteobacteria bacterium]|nr:thiamine-phosphate kinase [Gammaproteobacteria bacterium]